MNNDGTIQTEAGVGSSPGSLSAVGAVQKVVQGGFDSGIAAVNTSDESASAILEAYDSDGNLVGLNTSDLNLQGRNHTAKFLSELFPSLKDEDLEGTVRVKSDKPIALVILRTGGGRVLSSLPVGSLEN